ncbi:MAG: 5-formyltetrahydrofolate cyclo-ligase [Clostridia bacterium]|nr:5-formyltetrahydrofolate cyclo-ligase [Clostridia bacterium]
MEKKELRNQLRTIRNNLSEYEIEDSSQKITKQIIKEPWFVSAKTVLLYRSANSEVKTDLLWKACRDMGKICLFPKCISKTEMIAVQAAEAVEFSLSAYGIMEPVSNEEISKHNIDLIFVPGLGFDKQKYRIGYGAGYYDRYLKDFSGITCGLCYEKTLRESVFSESHDISLSYLATESGVLK